MTRNFATEGQNRPPRPLPVFGRAHGVFHGWTATTVFVLSMVVCRAALFVAPDSTIEALTHWFNHDAPAGPTTVISDSPETNQFTQSAFAATLTGSETVTWRVKAADGKKFVVHAPPTGFGNIILRVLGDWLAASDGGIAPTTNTVTFENLVGPTPTLLWSACLMGGGGKWLRFQGYFAVAPRTEFTAVQFSSQYAFVIPSTNSQSFLPDGFEFSCYSTSSEVLGDAAVLTLESLPTPTLDIAFSSGTAVLTWPTNFTNWVLESSTGCAATDNWSLVTNYQAVIGTSFVVTNKTTESSRYFRLKAQ